MYSAWSYLWQLLSFEVSYNQPLHCTVKLSGNSVQRWR